MSAAPPVVVLGRFPPPPDGQTLATERCASFLDDAFDVTRLDTEPPGPPALTAHPTFSVSRAAHFLRLRRRLADALRRHAGAPVLWHAISPAPLGHARDVLATVPTFAPGQPVVGVLHRATFDALFGSAATRWSARRLVRRLDGLVFQSPALAARCGDEVPEAKRILVPNTVRDAAVPSGAEVEARRAVGPGRPLRVLFLSNHLPEKGHADVLEAVARLAARGVVVRATFAGGWPSADARAAFEARIGRLGVDAEVLGPVAEAAEVRRLHLEADVFALPTTHPTETQPIAILEALAAGTPVVSVDRPVLRDMVEDGVEGALVPPHTPAAIADALEALAAPDRWRAASAAARARFDRQFSPAVVGAQWRAVAARLTAAG